MKDDASVTVDLASLARYLHFDSRTFTISGTVPVDFPTQGVRCSLTATSKEGTGKESQTFYIAVSKATTTTGPKQSSDNTNHSDHGPDGRKTAIIVGVVIGAVCGVFLLVAFAVCLRRRHKFARSYLSPKLPRSPRKSEISRPYPKPWSGMDETFDEDEGMGKDFYKSVVARTSEHPPKLDLRSPKISEG
jgi:hypothetical protein